MPWTPKLRFLTTSTSSARPPCDADDAQAALDQLADYLRLAGDLSDLPEDAWLSIDLSHLGMDVDPLGCANRLAAIAGRLTAGRPIQVGAEDHDRADAVVERVLTVAGPRPG